MIPCLSTLTHMHVCICTLSLKKDFHLIGHFSNIVSERFLNVELLLCELGFKVQLTNTIPYFVTYLAKQRIKTKWKKLISPEFPTASPSSLYITEQ